MLRRAFPSALSSLAHGSPEGGQRGRGEQASQKQVVEGGVAGGWMLAFGVGRWSWALVWATVSGEERAQGWGRVRENGKREGRGETNWQRATQSDGGTRAVGQVGQPWCPGIGGVWSGRDRLGWRESSGVLWHWLRVSWGPPGISQGRYHISGNSTYKPPPPPCSSASASASWATTHVGR